jgi:hypothetical protein
MRFREHQRDESHGEEPPNPSGSTPSGLNLGRLREAGERLLQSSDDAINQALSQDSEAFLTANLQEGGQ